MKKIKNLLFTLLLVLSMAAPSSIPVIGTVQSVSAAAKISSKNVVLIKGQKKQLKLSGTTKTVKWTSSSKSIASVSNTGKVTAKKKGTAVVTAKAGISKYTCKITVQTPSISAASKSIKAGQKIRLTVKGTNQKVAWKSSNSKIASVSSGIVTGKKAGTCVISATVLGKKYNCRITVKQPAAQIQYVWLSATGTKYHKIPNCGNMNPSKARQVTLAEAKSRYTPCSKCF